MRGKRPTWSTGWRARREAAPCRMGFGLRQSRDTTCDRLVPPLVTCRAMTEPFGFLRSEWPDVHEAASQAAASPSPTPNRLLLRPPRARAGGRLGVQARPRPEAALPGQLSALIHEPTFKAAVGEAVFAKRAHHQGWATRRSTGQRPILGQDGVARPRAVPLRYWLARTYARGRRPDPGLRFDPASCPRGARPCRRPWSSSRSWRPTPGAEQDLSSAARRQGGARRRAGAPARRGRRGQEGGEARPDTHDYSEAETRGRLHRPAA